MNIEHRTSNFEHRTTEVQPERPERLLTRTEAAEYLRCSTRTIDELWRKGRLLKLMGLGEAMPRTTVAACWEAVGWLRVKGKTPPGKIAPGTAPTSNIQHRTSNIEGMRRPA